MSDKGFGISAHHERSGALTAVIPVSRKDWRAVAEALQGLRPWPVLIADLDLGRVRKVEPHPDGCDSLLAMLIAPERLQ